MQQIIAKLESDGNPQNKPVIGPNDITFEFIYNLISNYGTFPSGRRYTFQHNIENFSEYMLRIKYQEKLVVTKDNLLNSSQIGVLLDEFKNELPEDKEVFATLAYDAATVDAENGKDNNLFVFKM